MHVSQGYQRVRTLAGQSAGIVRPGDLSSPGWSSGGVWPFVVTMLAQSSVLLVLPVILVSVAVPVALLGWIGLNTPLGLRAALWSSGMVTGFMFLGRPDNFYWGMMLATTLPLGLAFAPQLPEGQTSKTIFN